jgi:hypothetical protein
LDWPLPLSIPRKGLSGWLGRWWQGGGPDPKRKQAVPEALPQASAHTSPQHQHHF